MVISQFSMEPYSKSQQMLLLVMMFIMVAASLTSLLSAGVSSMHDAMFVIVMGDCYKVRAQSEQILLNSFEFVTA